MNAILHSGMTLGLAWADYMTLDMGIPLSAIVAEALSHRRRPRHIVDFFNEVEKSVRMKA